MEFAAGKYARNLRLGTGSGKGQVASSWSIVERVGGWRRAREMGGGWGWNWEKGTEGDEKMYRDEDKSEMLKVGKDWMWIFLCICACMFIARMQPQKYHGQGSLLI